LLQLLVSTSPTRATPDLPSHGTCTMRFTEREHAASTDPVSGPASQIIPEQKPAAFREQQGRTAQPCRLQARKDRTAWRYDDNY